MLYTFSFVEIGRLLPEKLILIIIIMSLFKEDDLFSTKTNLTYGPLKSKTYMNNVIYICTKYDVWNTYQNMYNFCS